jgi:hypothetical protein
MTRRSEACLCPESNYQTGLFNLMKTSCDYRTCEPYVVPDDCDTEVTRNIAIR